MAEIPSNRKELRDSTIFVDIDFNDVDPRRFYRVLRREVEQVRERNLFKYSIEEPDVNMPETNAESVGNRSGRIKGGFIATTRWEKFATDEATSSNPGAIISAIVGLVGVLVFISAAGVSDDDQGVLAGAGFILILIAAAIYYFSSPTTRTSDYYFRKRSRIFMEGEAAERMMNSSNEEQPAIISNELNLVIGEEIEVRGEDDIMPLSELSEDYRSQLADELTPIVSEIEELPGDSTIYTRRLHQ